MASTEPRSSLDDVRRRHAELDQKMRALKARTFDGADRRRMARVTVDGDGRFVSVRLDSTRVDDSSAEEVAGAVLAALAEARRILAEALRDAVGGPAAADLAERVSRITI